MLEIVDVTPPELPGFGRIVDARQLSGGMIHKTWLFGLSDGSQIVVKSGEHVPTGLFLAEAEGLRAIASTGAVATPTVLHVDPDHLVLEPLLPPPADNDAFWEEAGRAVAALHAYRGPAYGWHYDNWLGLLPQRNGWCENGHEFFVQNRILRFLEEPALQAVLSAETVAGIERVCERFGDLVPVMPPVLCHGDLWKGNFVAAEDGHPAVIDPAVTYTWAEVDLSMMYCNEPPSQRFFDAYHEVNPPEPGWRERMELLNLRELLSVLAHLGEYPDLCEPTVSRVHALVATYG